MTDFDRARKSMVDSQLRTCNVMDRRLLRAMGTVPRERFVPESRRSLAYIDAPHQLLPGKSRRALSAPVPFALLVQLADVKAEDTVLDVGSGTGYPTAVLAALARSVVGIEPQAELAAKARETLTDLGIDNVEIVEAQLDDRGAAPGPFDVIVLEGAVDEVPATLFERLAEGGRLVALLRQGAAAVAHLYVKSGEEVAGKADFNASLPPLLDLQEEEEFVF